MATLTVHNDGDWGLDRRREVIVVCEASHILIVVHSENTSIDLFPYFISILLVHNLAHLLRAESFNFEVTADPEETWNIDHGEPG